MLPGSHADAVVNGAEQLDGQTDASSCSRALRRVKAGQAVAEVAVATVVLPVVLPGLVVPAGICSARAACKNLLGLQMSR